MKKMIFALTLFCLTGLAGTAAAAVDNTLYAQLLSKHVHKGRVDYSGFKTDEQILDQYLDQLSRTDPGTLSRTARFAFYINVYNAFTIKLILTKYPGINSIKEIGSFFSGPWDKKFIPLNGRTVTLDHIEHEILRPQFKDPRVHVAINCASKGCPPLRSEPYEPETLEAQLDEQARAFINSPRFNRFKEGTLYLSRIFKWFKEDFNDNPLPFVRQYAAPPLAHHLSGTGQDIRISYLDYDWSLNQ